MPILPLQLTHPQRTRLLDALGRSTLFDQAEGRNLLLADLPAALKASLVRSATEVVDLDTIIETSESWDELVNGTPALLIVIDNARSRLKDSDPGRELDALYNELQSQLPPPLLPIEISKDRAEVAVQVTEELDRGRRPKHPPHNLPMERSRLVGRRHEVARLKALLLHEETGLVTCTGPGGIGKTRLALQVAHELHGRFADGVFLVSLAAIRDPDLVVATLAQTLGLREVVGQLLLESIKDYLRDRQILLIFDSFEQVLDAGPVVNMLLTQAPELKVLVTSRSRLHLHGEREFPVPPLQLPSTRPLPSIETLSQFEAVTLFIQRARAVQPGFQVTNDNAPAIAEICHRLDGLPLAIELAAVRIKMFPPQALLARLQRRLTLLRGGARDRPARQQTLEAAIAWSYDLLPATEQSLFRRLAVFTGGATLEAVAAVCNPVEQLPALTIDILDGISSLMDKSLIFPLASDNADAGDEPRFGMLETIQEYAEARLVESSEATILRRQHALYFLTVAETAETHLKGATQDQWLLRLEMEHHNLRGALQWAREQAGEIGLRLAGALWRFWYIRGYYSEGRLHLTTMLAISGNSGSAARARALHGAGVLAWGQGDYSAAQIYSEESLALYRTLEDNAGIANALNNLGLIARSQGDYPTAHTRHTESLVLRRALGDWWGIANAFLNLGVVAWIQGEYEEARRLFEESLAIERLLGDRWGIALVLDNLGLVARSQEDLLRARALLEESLALRRALRDEWGIATALQHLADVALDQGAGADAQTLLQESLTRYREVGDTTGSATVLYKLAQAAEAAGDLGGAHARLLESLAMWQATDSPAGIAHCLEEWARLAAAHEQPERAARLWGAAAALRATRAAPLPLPDRAAYDRTVAAAHAQLGSATWAVAWAAGQEMALEQALTYAQKPVAEPETNQVLARDDLASPKVPAIVSDYPNGLTEREVTVLCLVAQGLSNKEIGRELSLSPHTVNVHLRTIYSKINVSSRAAATRFAFEHQLL